MPRPICWTSARPLRGRRRRYVAAACVRRYTLRVSGEERKKEPDTGRGDGGGGGTQTKTVLWDPDALLSVRLPLPAVAFHVVGARAVTVGRARPRALPLRCRSARLPRRAVTAVWSSNRYVYRLPRSRLSVRRVQHNRSSTGGGGGVRDPVVGLPK